MGGRVSLSEVSEPAEEDSESSAANFRPTRGEAGGRRPHTCVCRCSQMRRNRRMFPAGIQDDNVFCLKKKAFKVFNCKVLLQWL